MNNWKQTIKSQAATYYLPLLLAIPITPIAEFFQKYVFGDWEFVKFLVILIIVDTVLSWVYHIWRKDFSSSGFSQMFKKLLIYGCLLIVSHTISSFTVKGEVVETFSWMRTLICTALIVREAISIVENASKLSPSLVPPFIRKYLNEFNKRGYVNNPEERRNFENKN